MAFNQNPTNWLPSYSYDGGTGNISFSAAEINLAAEEADNNNANADSREIWYRLLDNIYTYNANLVNEDKPVNVPKVQKTVSFNANANSYSVTYTLNFNVVMADSKVIEEPEAS
jgi:hypothetical protein